MDVWWLLKWKKCAGHGSTFLYFFFPLPKHGRTEPSGRWCTTSIVCAVLETNVKDIISIMPKPKPAVPVSKYRYGTCRSTNSLIIYGIVRLYPTGKRVLCDLCSKHKAARWFKASSITGHLRSSAHKKVALLETERQEAQRLHHERQIHVEGQQRQLNYVHNKVPQVSTEAECNEAPPAVYKHELYYNKYREEITFTLNSVFKAEEAEKRLRKDYCKGFGQIWLYSLLLHFLLLFYFREFQYFAYISLTTCPNGAILAQPQFPILSALFFSMT